MDFNNGTRFDSFKDFSIALEQCGKKMCANYYRATSVELKFNTNISNELIQQFKLKRAYYKCKFGGEYSTQAQTRHNTQTYKQGCNARFAIGLKKMDGVYALQLKHIEQNHNHERADDLYRRMPKQRNLAIQDSRQFLQRVANVKADTKLLQFEVSKSNTEKYQVKRKDINNFNAKNKQAVGITDLEKVDGAAVKIVILLTMDGNGESQIVALFIVISENDIIMSEMFRQFKIENNNWDKTEVIMTDKAMVNLNVARTEFPNAVHHLCIFHVQQIFIREIQTKKRDISAAQRAQCLIVLNNMIYADSEAEYNRLYDELLSFQYQGKLFPDFTVQLYEFVYKILFTTIVYNSTYSHPKQ